MDQHKVCSRCCEAKPLSEFTKNRRLAEGLAHYCRTCKAVAASEYYQRKRSERRAYSFAYYANNREQAIAAAATARDAEPERMRTIWRKSRKKTYRENTERYRLAAMARTAVLKYGVTTFNITSDQMRAKTAYWGDRCWMCGGAYEAIDHVKPLSKGGPHILANLRPICTSCNSKKAAKWPLAA